MVNEEIAIIYSKRCAAQVALLFWKKRVLSVRSIVVRSIISLFYVALYMTYRNIPLNGLVDFFVVVTLLLGMLIYEYLKLLVRLLGQVRRLLGRTVKYVLHDDRISISSYRGVAEVLWLDLDIYAKSSDVTVFYSSRKKTLIFFPNAMLSEKVQAYMLEKFNEAVTERLNERLKPPILANASNFKKKCMTAIIVILVLALAMLIGHCNYRSMHSIINSPMETNNIIQH